MQTKILDCFISEYGGVIQTGPFGSQLHQSEYVLEGIPVIMPKDIVDGKINDSTVARVSEQKAAELLRHKVKEGTIIFPRRGDISKCAYIKKEQEGYLCGTGCIKIEVSDVVLSSRFLFYYFQLGHVTDWFERNAVGTTMLNLNTSIMGRVQIPIIDIRMQEEIADILTVYDDLIENNQRRIALLEESARLLYREWFVNLRFPGHEHVKIIDGVPEGWIKKVATDVLQVLSGGTPKTGVGDYWDGHIPFYTPKDALDCTYVIETEKYITNEGLRHCNSKLYPKDTVFITARGTVGKINLAQSDMAINQSCYALIAAPPISQFFLYYSIQQSVNQLKNRAGGAVFDAIIRDTFNHISVLVPPPTLISMFDDYVSPILRSIEINLEQNRKLTQARDLLLPRLMSGEIAV